ncbi:coatomer subunit epsilon (macronuclear) [Tetrahymena thermophila SB210]|uniref:Coatomer subunit epsilon n=1 Tax=Tetrahymena thermophila (strain SB210) TaxID=312017 RepID=I7MI91_TETTS|nr:coatomer subunit epsilon [Tetrahymena thermophila SB210]EAS03995.1 coatomer subunit epsilon [Tetrahymena thermophila SB210]|eukprot:XP_001024240.1 coatomer subunit epsilon [Tetrahymena thermophila SB210]
MDPQDLLDSFRQNYYLGNFSKILDKWNQTDDSQFGQHLQQINFFVARAIKFHKQYSPKHQVQFTKQPSQQLLAVAQAVNEYLTPLVTSSSESFQQLEQSFRIMTQKMNEIYQQNGQNIYSLIICCYLGLAGNDLTFFTSNEAKFRENYELLYLYILILLKNAKIEQADVKLQEMRKMNDEDVLTLLATVHILMAKEKYNDAIKYIDEIKERFGDSTKLVNIKISCYMQQQKWSEAFTLAEKLLQVMNSKDELYDKQELEVCLSNLIILGEILDKSNPDYYTQLSQINQNAPFIKKFTEMSESYQEMSTKLSLK